MDGYDFILTSPQRLVQMGHKYENLHSNIYLKGHLDFETGHFDIVEIHELDGGSDFYAPQTLTLPDGRVVMIAWKEMWDRTYPTEYHNWIGTYSLPRELVVQEGMLYQKPIREIQNYYSNTVKADDFSLNSDTKTIEGFEGNTIECKVDIIPGDCSRIGLKLLKGQNHETYLYYDTKEKVIVLDRTNSGEDIGGLEPEVNIRRCDFDEEVLSLDIFIDISSIEVFINGGKHVMTANVYGDVLDDQGIEFFSDQGHGEFKNLVKYDIEVK